MKHKGFTVIELVVVIAIIGLIAAIAVTSLQSAKARSRDAKRMEDIHQISQAIDLYIAENNSLPRGAAGWCTYISNTANNWGPDFQNDIKQYLPQVPLDPLKHGQVGDYFYVNADNVSKYILCAELESNTGKTYDYSACSGGSVYNYCIMPNGS